MCSINCIPHFPIREFVGSRTSLFTDLEGLGKLVLSFLVKSRFLNAHGRTTLEGGRFRSPMLVCVLSKLLLFLLNTVSHILESCSRYADLTVPNVQLGMQCTSM